MFLAEDISGLRLRLSFVCCFAVLAQKMLRPGHYCDVLHTSMWGRREAFKSHITGTSAQGQMEPHAQSHSQMTQNEVSLKQFRTLWLHCGVKSLAILPLFQFIYITLRHVSSLNVLLLKFSFYYFYCLLICFELKTCPLFQQYRYCFTAKNSWGLPVNLHQTGHGQIVWVDVFTCIAISKYICILWQSFVGLTVSLGFPTDSYSSQ